MTSVSRGFVPKDRGSPAQQRSEGRRGRALAPEVVRDVLVVLVVRRQHGRGADVAEVAEGDGEHEEDDEHDERHGEADGAGPDRARVHAARRGHGRARRLGHADAAEREEHVEREGRREGDGHDEPDVAPAVAPDLVLGRVDGVDHVVEDGRHVRDARVDVAHVVEVVVELAAGALDA